jgi:ornithine carbamoyltransferase
MSVITKTKRRHLISLNDLSDEALFQIIDRGLAYANGSIKDPKTLQGLVVGIYFRKTSTRTRTSFSTAALRLGAGIISYNQHDLQENTGESIEDTAKVLSMMLDGFVARTAGPQAEMEIFAAQKNMGVVNAMSEDEHPTQALADLTTMLQHFGDLSGLRILYMGEGNNTATALALALTRFQGTHTIFCTPPEYGIPRQTLLRAQKYAATHNSFISEQHTVDNLPGEVDIIYTTRWQTTGTSKHTSDWREVFAPFKVSQELLDKYPNAIFMHDLPAHREEEVSASVLDGPRSIAFKQAGNKLNSACAVLEWSLRPDLFF